uniref:Uncharacterized protein n=1 Tax=Salix viminalis TaxID=40686 RepID=A0A6N2M601_SALVM
MGIKEPAGIVSKEQDTLDQWKSDPSRPEIEFRQPRVTCSTQRTSTDRPPKLIESASNGLASVVSAQSEQVHPLLSLLEKEPPSKHFSGQLEYARHLSGLERHESILPLLHASEKKTNEVSGRGRENGNLDSMPRISHKTVGKKVGAIAPNEGAASTSGIVSQTASDQVPTLAIHEKSSLKTSSGRLSMNKVAAACAPLHGSTDMHDQDQALSNGDMESPDVRGKNIDRRDGGKTNSTHVENESFVFATRTQDNGLQKTSMNLGGNELSKFSDTPRDASLDDLFHPLDKNPEDRAAEASTSASTSHMNQGNALRATIAQKQMENEMGQTNGGGDLFSLMMGVLKDGVIDIDGLVFDEKLPPENLFPLQVVNQFFSTLSNYLIYTTVALQSRLCLKYMY